MLGFPWFFCDSCRFTLVVIEQPREIGMPTNRPDILIDQASWRRPTALPKRDVAQRLVRS